MSEVAQDIIAKLLNPNPEKRLGAGGKLYKYILVC